MKIRIILCFVASLVCHLVHAQEDRRAKTISTIRKHVESKMATDGEYASFSFGKLVRNQPKAYLELEELINVKNSLPDMRHHYRKTQYDSVVSSNKKAIQAKKVEIMENNIRPNYQMVHAFVIKNKTGVSKVYKMDFYVNFDYEITDVRLLYTSVLTNDEVKQYYYYEKRIPVFSGDDAYRNNYLSRKLYDQYEDGLRASEFDLEILHAALRVVKIIRQYGELDLDKLGELSIKHWVINNAEDLKGYKRIETSYMYEINSEIDGKKELIGYKMFHKYSYTDDDGTRLEDVVYFEFDLFFVIRGILRVPEPYDMYFKKN